MFYVLSVLFGIYHYSNVPTNIVIDRKHMRNAPAERTTMHFHTSEAGNHHFLLFSQCFQSYQKIIIFTEFILLSANALNSEQSRILSFGKELTSRKSVRNK